MNQTSVQVVSFSVAVCGIMLLAFTGSSAATQTTSMDYRFAARKEGGLRRWEVTADSLQLYAAPTTDSAALKGLKNGAIVSNLGCTKVNALLWCHVQPLKVSLRGYLQAQHLRPAIGPDGIVAYGLDDSKRRARKRDFDHRTEIQCAQERHQALQTCSAAVTRSGGGDATVVVTFKNGFTRQLYFVHGEFMRASPSMSGVGTDTEWQMRGAVYSLRVDDQRYELPESLILSKD